LFKQKTAEVTPGSAASPLPQVEVTPTQPTGKRGPIGIGPRTNYSRVNTGAPPVPDAGSQAQKSMAPRGAEMLPKLGSGEDSMTLSAVARPTLQDMVTSAMTGAASRASIVKEAAHQQALAGAGLEGEVPAVESIETDYVMKLASAVDYVAEQVKQGASLAGAYNLKEGKVEPGKGPGALKVMQATATGTPPGPGQQGAGHHQPPKNPGVEKARPAEHSPTKMESNLAHPVGGKMLEKNNSAKTEVVRREKFEKMAASFTSALKAMPKEASEKVIVTPEKTAAETCPDCKKPMAECTCKSEKKASPDNLVDYMLSLTKKAEDAINPAQISAGAAVPPATSAAGESGGAPAGGSPQGPSGLVSSNQGAIDYKKSQAYANRKADLGKYLTEPAMSGATDKTLAEAFAHTSEAGTKFASASPAMKTAAAKALLMKLADEAEARAKKN
jgi:hypothetical protein